MSKVKYNIITFVFQLGAVAACPFAGFALDALGRKRSMLYLTLPFVIGWLFIGLAQNFFMVLFGRFVTGKYLEKE